MEDVPNQMMALRRKHVENIQAASATRLQLKRYQALDNTINEFLPELRKRLEGAWKDLEAEESKKVKREIEEIDGYPDLAAAKEAKLGDDLNFILRWETHGRLSKDSSSTIGVESPPSKLNTQPAGQNPRPIMRQRANSTANEMDQASISGFVDSQSRSPTVESPVSPGAHFPPSPAQPGTSINHPSQGHITRTLQKDENAEIVVGSPLVLPAKRSIEKSGLRTSSPVLDPDAEDGPRKISRHASAHDSEAEQSEQGQEDEDHDGYEDDEDYDDEDDEDDEEDEEDEDDEDDEDNVGEDREAEESLSLPSSPHQPPPSAQPGRSQPVKMPSSSSKVSTSKMNDTPASKRMIHSDRPARRSSTVPTGGYNERAYFNAKLGRMSREW